MDEDEFDAEMSDLKRRLSNMEGEANALAERDLTREQRRRLEGFMEVFER